MAGKRGSGAKYVEVLDRLEARRDAFLMGMLATAAAALVLAVALWAVVTSPKPVVVVPGATRAGLFKPGEIPAEALRDFARDYAVSLVHFTPSTIADRLARARKRSAPPVQARMEAETDQILAHVKAHSVSQSFTPERVEVARAGRDRWTAAVEGLMVQYVGERPVRRGRYRIGLGLERTEATEDNPWGVWVTSVTQGFVEEKGKR